MFVVGKVCRQFVHPMGRSTTNGTSFVKKMCQNGWGEIRKAACLTGGGQSLKSQTAIRLAAFLQEREHFLHPTRESFKQDAQTINQHT